MNLKALVLALSSAALLSITTISYAAPDGLITKSSQFSVKTTIDKLESILKKKGITVMLRWNHSDRAKGVGIDLRPTELIIFGNPKLGSHMFTAEQTSGIDLPLKALAWKDAEGQVWLSYNDPAYVAKRHDITNRQKIVNKMTGVLNKLTNFATGKK